MPISEGVKGTFDWSVVGLEKLDAMDKRLLSLEQHMGKGVPEASGKMASAHAISGEKLVKYGTSVGMLTGQMQRLGVQNDLVARGLQIGAEAATGMLGPIGLVTIAIGALATGIGALVLKHRENEQAIKDSSKAMLTAIDANIKLAALSNPSGAIARTYLLQTEQEVRDSVFDLEQRQRELFGQRQAGGVTNQVGIVGPGFRKQYQFVPYSTAEMAKINTDAAETAIALVLAKEQQLKLQLASFVGPPISPQDIAATEERQREQARTGAAGMFSFSGMSLTAFNGQEEGRAGALGSSNRDALLAISDPAKEAYGEIAKASALSAEQQAYYLDQIIQKHQTAYGAMKAFTMSTQKASSLFVERALEGENVSRLKGLTVARYVASGAAAAVIRELGQKAEKKAAWEAAEAIASFAIQDYRGGALHVAAAAGYGALAGGASGLAAGMESTAQRQFDRETTRSGVSSGYAAGNGSSGISASSNPGARIAASGASVGTINYNFIITYQGAAVYGEGGTRDWFYRELVPLINEGVSTGSISRN